MTDADPHPDPLARIDEALARIDRAARSLTDAHHRLSARHGRMRDHVAEALAEIETLTAGDPAGARRD